MAAAFVQNIGNNTVTSVAGTGITMAFGSNVTAGNFIVVVVFAATVASSITFRDTLGNVYTVVESLFWAGSGTNGISVAYAKSIKGGACTVTVSETVGGVALIGLANEYSGISKGLWRQPYDLRVRSGSSVAGTPTSGTSLVTEFPAELVIGVTAQAGAATAQTLGAGYSNLFEQTNAGGSLAIEDKTISTAAAQTATFGTSYTNWSCGAYTFMDDTNGRRVINRSRTRPYPFAPGRAR